MKTAFIVTVHYSKQFRPRGHEFLDKYIDTLQKYMVSNTFDLFIVENASTDLYAEVAPEVIRNNKYNYMYIPSREGGLTRLWEIGLQAAILNGNDLFVLSNEDVFFNESIDNLIPSIESHKDKDTTVYGPLCDNRTTFEAQRGYELVDRIRDITGQHLPIHGWFFAFTKQYYDAYNINGKLFNEDKPWSGNEFFQKRDWEKGGHSCVIENCLVHHEHVGSWRRYLKDKDQKQKAKQNV